MWTVQKRALMAEKQPIKENGGERPLWKNPMIGKLSGSKPLEKCPWRVWVPKKWGKEQRCKAATLGLHSMDVVITGVFFLWLGWGSDTSYRPWEDQRKIDSFRAGQPTSVVWLLCHFSEVVSRRHAKNGEDMQHCHHYIYMGFLLVWVFCKPEITMIAFYTLIHVEVLSHIMHFSVPANRLKLWANCHLKTETPCLRDDLLSRRKEWLPWSSVWYKTSYWPNIMRLEHWMGMNIRWMQQQQLYLQATWKGLGSHFPEGQMEVTLFAFSFLSNSACKDHGRHRLDVSLEVEQVKALGWVMWLRLGCQATSWWQSSFDGSG